MNGIDVTCGNCTRSFRVRPEFAGRTTRCPNCSASLTIGASSAPAPRAREERPRAQLKDNADDRPNRPSGNWKPLNRAFAREQTAIVLLGIDILADAMIACLGSMTGPNMPAILVVLAILVTGLPLLVAFCFAVGARLAATGAPEGSMVRGTARCSLACLLFPIGFAIYFMIGSALASRPTETVGMVSLVGSILSALAALVTFGACVGQTAIALRSIETSIWLTRLAITTVSSIVIMAVMLGGWGLLDASLASPYGYYRLPDAFGPVALFMFAISIAIHLVIYHRMLAAAREAVRMGQTA